MTFPAAIDINWLQLSPLMTLIATASIALLYNLGDRDTRGGAGITVTGLILAGVFNYALMRESEGGPITAFGGRLLADQLTTSLWFVIIVGAVLAILVAWNYIHNSEVGQPEYYPLLLLSASGAMVMVAAGDLITLLLGLEIMSLAVYVLSAFRLGHGAPARQSQEAGMKYFLLGAFASAVMIYGIALLYGATGSFHYTGVHAAVTAPDFGLPVLAAVGGLLLLGGLAFKAAIFPLQQWAPDVYTGAPTPVTTFMSVVVKTAAFAALLRVGAGFLPEVSPAVIEVFSWLVGATMVIGNFGALAQQGIKRMLAYSSVAHAGYLGLAVLAASTDGFRAASWYLMAYTLMTAGAFAVLALVSRRDDTGDTLSHFAGLGRRQPGLALAMAIFMLSLAGIPPLAGFAGKLFVFSAAIGAGYVVLAVVGIVTSIVGVYYYFRVIKVMYFDQSSSEALPGGIDVAGRLAIALAAVGTVVLGVFPAIW
mgnify:CR=1 FL=1